MILISDGISSVASDDEVVDLARDAANPKEAADAITAYAEDLGSDDNATALVVPLPGWGKIIGPDKTKELREYKKKETSAYTLAEFELYLSMLQLDQNVLDGCETK